MKKVLDRILEQLGIPAVEPERTLLAVGETLEAFEAMRPTIAAVTSRYLRLQILLSSRNRDVVAALTQWFPECRVLPLPANNALHVHLFLQRCNVRVAAFVEPRADPSPVLLAGLKKRAVTTLVVSARSGADLLPGPRLVDVCEALIEIGEARPESGNKGDQLQHLLVQDVVDLLGDFLARDLKPLRQKGRERRGPGALLLAIAGNSNWSWLTAWRLQRCKSVADLRKALDAPETILCVGNGPSSEDPAIAGVKYDALFRVNHSWLERGLLTKPNVVFTGGKPTMRAVKAAIFGFQTSDAEARFAVMRMLAWTSDPARFFNANDLTRELHSFSWGTLRPTNGAAMLAVAVALQPARLVIAGIDLFEHQDGTYPGDTATPNAYSPGHSRDSELSFILDLLSGYQGELRIIGDALNAELKKAGKRTASAAN